MNSEKLHELTRKDLANMARKKGVAGWYLMRKEELVHVLADFLATRSARPQTQPAAARNTTGAAAGGSGERKHQNGRPPTRDLSVLGPGASPAGRGKDRIVAMVRDPYWLHCYWEVSRKAIQQAEAALGQDWHGAWPILRLLDVSSRDTTSHSETVVRDIEIHGGCNNWYIDVANPPRSYRIDIGYRSPRGPFYALARSNVVTTPRAGASHAVDGNWADLDMFQAERLYAMSGGFGPLGGSKELKQLIEERLQRPLGAPTVIHFGSESLLGSRMRKLWLQMDAELIVYGATEPTARVTLQGEPIKLRADGTFTMRFSLPDSRQIIPATATSCDGSEEQTIVLAIERNTKQLELQVHDLNGEGT
jgi:hypothetical protein